MGVKNIRSCKRKNNQEKLMNKNDEYSPKNTRIENSREHKCHIPEGKYFPLKSFVFNKSYQ